MRLGARLSCCTCTCTSPPLEHSWCTRWGLTLLATLDRSGSVPGRKETWPLAPVFCSVQEARAPGPVSRPAPAPRRFFSAPRFRTTSPPPRRFARFLCALDSSATETPEHRLAEITANRGMSKGKRDALSPRGVYSDPPWSMARLDGLENTGR